MKTQINRARQKAFTLVEIIVSMTVLSLLLVGLTSSFIMGLRIYHLYSGRISVNKDIRDFTNELIQSATYANYFEIYPSFTERTKIISSGGVDVTVNGKLHDGLSGDLLVLVYVNPVPPTRITRVIGIYRAAGAGAKGPVRSFILNYPSGTTAALSSLLPAASTINDHPEVVRLARGLSNGRMFYNFSDKSVIVQGELEQEGSGDKKATNTYNFTISPRS